MPDSLTLETLRRAVAGSAAAFRCVTEYQPAGGPGDKVFPPTYEGGKYATEKRYVPGREGPVDCVLLDSVQSQANRMELALLDAWEAGRIELPVIVVDFTNDRLEKRLRVTSLDAPHRIADAILRDSYDGNGKGRVLFRQSERGKRLDMVDLRNATPLLEMCPTALVFGMWDSTGPKGGLGAKFQRALVSEIVGHDATAGVKTSSRIDPAQIVLGAGPLFRRQDGRWTPFPDDAVREGNPEKDGKVKLLLYGKVKKKDVWHEVPVLKTSSGKPTVDPSKAERRENPAPQLRLYHRTGNDEWINAGDFPTSTSDAARPSISNHGNVTPTIDVRKDSNGNPVREHVPAMFLRDNRDFVVYREHETPSCIGGFTISKAVQTTTMSLPALRRLHFPVDAGGRPASETERKKQDDINGAGRTALAALGLCAATLARESGCDLRSRCQLVATTPFEWEFLDKPGESEHARYALSGNEAIKLLNDAVADLRKHVSGAWPKNPIELTPSDELLELVVRSQKLAAAGKGATAVEE